MKETIVVANINYVIRVVVKRGGVSIAAIVRRVER